MPVSVFVTAISFGIYLVARFIGWWRGRSATRDDIAAGRWATSANPDIDPDCDDCAGRHPAP